MEVSGVERHLQTVVIGAIDISHLEDIGQVRELSGERPVGFLGTIEINIAVVIERSAGEAQGKRTHGTCVPARSDRRLIDVANAG